MLFLEDPFLAQKKRDAEDLRDRLMQAASKLHGIAVAAPAAPFSARAVLDAAAAANSNGQAVNGKATGANTASHAVVAGEEQLNGDLDDQFGFGTSRELTLNVQIGEHGIGLIIVHDQHSNYIAVKGFRPMPRNFINPAQAAGMRIGDRIVAINDQELVDHNHAVTLIRGARGTVKITIFREK